MSGYRPMPPIQLLHPSQLPAIDTWVEDALCAEIGGDAWFPERGGPSRDALAVCGRCLARQPCLEMAVAYERTPLTERPTGIWGGTTGHERREWLRGLPGLCLDCPSERVGNQWYCRPCAARHLDERHERYDQLSRQAAS